MYFFLLKLNYIGKCVTNSVVDINFVDINFQWKMSKRMSLYSWYTYISTLLLNYRDKHLYFVDWFNDFAHKL